MSQSRVKQLEGANGVVKTAPVAPSTRKKASTEYVLAAQLNQARETIASLLGQVADQEQTIATLNQRLAMIELQNVQRENEKLREQHGLKVGAKLERDPAGEWWILEEAQAVDPATNS
jgi:uncharacterized coiled-coil protein SlyX